MKTTFFVLLMLAITHVVINAQPPAPSSAASSYDWITKGAGSGGQINFRAGYGSENGNVDILSGSLGTNYGNVTVGTTGTGSILLNTNGVNRFTLNGSGALTITGATSISNTLSVTGATTISNALNVSGTLTAGSFSAGSGNISTTGAVSAGTLTTSGMLTANGGFTTSKSILVGGLLTTGVITAGGFSAGNGGYISTTGAVSAGTLTTSGLLTANGGLTTSGTITAGSLTSNGNITISTSAVEALTLNCTNSNSLKDIAFRSAYFPSSASLDPDGTMGTIGFTDDLNMRITNNVPGGNITIWSNINVNIESMADVKILSANFQVIKGNLYARQVVVQTGTFPDYVFKPGYKLKSLAETEAYIKANGHLEDMPDEAMVKEKGINVAEMNAALLKKIEEITLLMIEQNKRVEALEKENGALKTKVEEISNK